MVTALSKIKTILDGISSSILPLKFKYLESKPASFPAAMLISNGFNESMFTNSSNQVVESFTIRLIYPQTESSAGYEKWLTLADAVSAEFRKKENQTLAGEAVSFQVNQGLPPAFSDAEYIQPVVIFDIIVEAKIIKQI